ncbi:MAG: hypothetical protein ACRD09_16275 [Vicinamibacterales bacterium]
MTRARNVEEPDTPRQAGGRRLDAGWDDVARLQTTAARLRGHDALVPRGVYRFSSFEEADTWMMRLSAATHVRHSRKTSPESAAP